MNRAHIDLRSGRYSGLNYSGVLALCALGIEVFGANMQCERFVALQLKVPHHFIERCARGRSRRFEPPATFGAAKSTKILLLNPHQFSAHGHLYPAPQRCLIARTRSQSRHAAYLLFARWRTARCIEKPPSPDVAERCLRHGVYWRQSEWSVERPT